MTVFELRATQLVPRPLAEVFRFFSDAGNLQAITPPWLGFEILTPMPLEMRAGTLLDYRIRLHGIPLKWRTRITAWEPPGRFVDEQLRGPYRLWVHEHTFREVPGGTEVGDRVRYAVPGGRLANRLFVAPDLEKVFAYRRLKICEALGGGEEGGVRITVSS